MAKGKKHEPTSELRRVVERGCIAGFTQEDIAKIVGISVDTLTLYYPEELNTAHLKVVSGISAKLAQKALGGDNACMFFYLKTRGGWQEVQRHEHTGKDGSDLIPTVNVTIKQSKP